MATLSSNHDWHLEGGGRRQGAESNTTGKKKASTGTLWPPRGRSKHFISQKYVFSCCALLKWKKTKTSISSNKRPNLISSTLFDHLFLAYWMEQYSICDEGSRDRMWTNSTKAFGRRLDLIYNASERWSVKRKAKTERRKRTKRMEAARPGAADSRWQHCHSFFFSPDVRLELNQCSTHFSHKGATSSIIGSILL